MLSETAAKGSLKNLSMPDQPPFFPQQTKYSCAVACLRMLLASHGINRAEEELRILCDCGTEGTDALRLVDAARQVGLSNTRKYNLTMDELLTEVAQGQNPIVYVKTRFPNCQFSIQHALLVTGFTSENIVVLDPMTGERSIPLFEFERDWRRMRGLTILCQK